MPTVAPAPSSDPDVDELSALISLARDDVREYIPLMIAAVDGDSVQEHPMMDLYIDSALACLADPKHCLIIAPPEHVKGLALDTPIPTPSGWTTMGEVQPGDFVFGADGKPTRVTHASGVFHRPCYRVHFADKTSIVADNVHLWKTRTRKPQNKCSVKSTEDIFKTQVAHGRPNHGVPVAGALQLPKADLPLDPYLLGLWLGDGTEKLGQISNIDDPVLQAFADAGFKIRNRDRCTWQIYGLSTVLRTIGVLGNKHIPDAYMRASKAQRLALLQGLMDTDGTCSLSGQCMFSQKRIPLTRQVHELICSLGFKVRWYVNDSVLNGRVIGLNQTLSFYPRSDMPVFRLERKYKRQLSSNIKGDRHRWQVIESVEEVDSVPTRCIAVDSADHLYLAGRSMIPTHNTTVIRWLLVWLKGKNPRLRIGLSSADMDRSKKTLTAMRKGIMSDINQLIFPEMLPDQSRSKERGEWSSTKLYMNGDVTDPSFEVYAFWGEALGGRVDIWLFDDHVSPENETSPTIRDKTWRRLNGTFLTRLTDNGIAFMLGNVWHRDDANHRMSQSTSVHTFWLGYNGTDEMYWNCSHPAAGWKHGESGILPRWEAVWPERRLMAKYLIDPATYRKTFGGKALSEEDMVFPPHEKWRLYAPEEIAPIKDQLRIYAQLDPAGGKYVKRGDYAAIAAVGISPERNLYLIGWRCWRGSPLEQAQALWDIHDWLKREGFIQGIHMAQVEVLPKDEGWIWPLIESINKTEQAAGNGLDVSLHSDHRAKASRIHSMLKHFRMGFLRFPNDWQTEIKASRETREFTQQIEEFQGNPLEHDDAPDALHGAIELAEREGPFTPRAIDDLQSQRMLAQYAREMSAENQIRRRGPDGKPKTVRRPLDLGRIR